MSTLSLSHASAFSTHFAPAPLTRKISRPVATPDELQSTYSKAVNFGMRASIAAAVVGLQFWIFFAH